MNINQTIQNRLFRSEFFLRSRGGIALGPDLVRSEYLKICSYLLVKHPTNHYLVIKCTKDYRYLLCVLAALNLGIPFIPVNESDPENRLDEIKGICPIGLVIDNETMESAINAESEDVYFQDMKDDSQLAYVIFTSGSTGRPKGVMISRRALASYLSWVGREYSFVKDKALHLQVTEFSFDISLTDVALFLTRNTSLVFSNFNKNFFILIQELEKYRISILSTVPNNLMMILDEGIFNRVDLSELKLLLIAGARFTRSLWGQCREKLSKESVVYNLYGPTETTIYSHFKRLSFIEDEDCHGESVSIGHPLDRLDSILNPDGSGELLVGGPQLMEGYIGEVEKTTNALIQLGSKTYYRTGDLSFKDSRGEFYITGRLDDTIKVRGFRVNLSDIESYLQKISYVKNSALIAVEHEVYENQVVAFVSTKKETSSNELKMALRDLVPEQMVPSEIFFLDEIPINANGKTDKRLILEIYRKQIMRRS